MQKGPYSKQLLNETPNPNEKLGLKIKKLLEENKINLKWKNGLLINTLNTFN